MKAYTCSWDLGNQQKCMETFQDSESLYAHFCTNHSTPTLVGDQKQFVCSWTNTYCCDKKFKSKDHLKSHFRSHIPYTPYICKECGRSFKWSHNLSKHMSRRHSNSKRPIKLDSLAMPAGLKLGSMRQAQSFSPYQRLGSLNSIRGQVPYMNPYMYENTPVAPLQPVNTDLVSPALPLSFVSQDLPFKNDINSSTFPDSFQNESVFPELSGFTDTSLFGGDWTETSPLLMADTQSFPLMQPLSAPLFVDEAMQPMKFELPSPVSGTIPPSQFEPTGSFKDSMVSPPPSAPVQLMNHQFSSNSLCNYESDTFQSQHFSDIQY